MAENSGAVTLQHAGLGESAVASKDFASGRKTRSDSRESRGNDLVPAELFDTFCNWCAESGRGLQSGHCGDFLDQEVRDLVTPNRVGNMPFLQKLTQEYPPPFFWLQGNSTTIGRARQASISLQGKLINRVHAVIRCESRKDFLPHHSARQITMLNRRGLKTEQRWRQSDRIMIGSAETSIPDVNAQDVELTSPRVSSEVIVVPPAGRSMMRKAAGKLFCVKRMMNTLRRRQNQRRPAPAWDLWNRPAPISKGAEASTRSQTVTVRTVPTGKPGDENTAAIQLVTGTSRDRFTRFDLDSLILLSTVSSFIIPLVQELQLSNAASGKPADCQS
jgi:hypothetical protein